LKKYNSHILPLGGVAARYLEIESVSAATYVFQKLSSISRKWKNWQNKE